MPLTKEVAMNHYKIPVDEVVALRDITKLFLGRSEIGRKKHLGTAETTIDSFEIHWSVVVSESREILIECVKKLSEIKYFTITPGINNTIYVNEVLELEPNKETGKKEKYLCEYINGVWVLTAV